MTTAVKSVVEGRAKLVRPFAYVAIALLSVALAVPAVAHAELPAPVLTGSNPASPGASLNPRILGEIPGGGTAKVVFGTRLRAAGPISRSPTDPTNTVKLYTDPACTVPAGEGTLEELAEGSGIQVSPAVTPNVVTTFYAKQSNLTEGESPCSTQGLPYRQVTNPPAAPTFESVTPASPANQNFPRLIGSADPEATVTVYASANCSGAVVASGSGAAFASPGIQVSVSDNSETSFSARATITVNFEGGGTGEFPSGCSPEPIVYQEVTPPTEGGGGTGGGSGGGSGGSTQPVASPPPAPRIHTVPGGVSRDDTPLVTGSAPGAATVKVYASPDCSGAVAATGPVGQFDTPGLQVEVPENAVTLLSAVSVFAGVQSSCSTSVQYTEDSTPPHTRITMGPAAKTRHRKVVFRFVDTSGGAPGTVFLCKVDKRKWRPCSSPLRLRHLRRAKHVVKVKATDPAGNAETKPAKRRFKVIR